MVGLSVSSTLKLFTSVKLYLSVKLYAIRWSSIGVTLKNNSASFKTCSAYSCS